jgi:peptide-methionine (S)-S-oxide reductase
MTPTPTTIRDFDERALDDDETKTATYALGCFWGPDAKFGALDGVIRTRVGYAGGTKPNPSYHALDDHTEVFQVDYDPETIAYTDLLEHVFRSHDPRRQTRKTQYQNIVFTATPDQRDALEAYLEANDLDPDTIQTRIEHLSRFYPAEDYHQKHSLRSQRALMEAFEEASDDDEDLRESPAAAKLNGYAAGHDIATKHNLGLTNDRTVRRR